MAATAVIKHPASHLRAPTPDARGLRRPAPYSLDDFVLRVDGRGRAYGRPADAAPLGAYAALARRAARGAGRPGAWRS